MGLLDLSSAFLHSSRAQCTLLNEMRISSKHQTDSSSISSSLSDLPLDNAPSSPRYNDDIGEFGGGGEEESMQTGDQEAAPRFPAVYYGPDREFELFFWHEKEVQDRKLKSLKECRTQHGGTEGCASRSESVSPLRQFL